MSDSTKPTGVEATTWDNLGQGWRMWCRCGEFSTLSTQYLQDAADEMMDHWLHEHGWGPS